VERSEFARESVKRGLPNSLLALGALWLAVLLPVVPCYFASEWMERQDRGLRAALTLPLIALFFALLFVGILVYGVAMDYADRHQKEEADG
jgi:Na+/proline symporter